MKITETNCETGETFERDMTAEEEQKHQNELTFAAEVQAQIDGASAARQSALAKLVALGLTEEEASTLAL
jgi:hypothetical protein